MNITSAVRSVQDFHITLSEQDAREAVTSPYIFADKLAEQLRAAGVVANGGGVEPKRRKPKLESHIQVGRGRKATRASLRKARRPNGKAAPKAARPGAHESGGSLERVQCPHCPKQIARKYLPHHLATKHPNESQTGASASAA